MKNWRLLSKSSLPACIALWAVAIAIRGWPWITLSPFVLLVALFWVVSIWDIRAPWTDWTLISMPAAFSLFLACLGVWGLGGVIISIPGFALTVYMIRERGKGRTK